MKTLFFALTYLLVFVATCPAQTLNPYLQTPTSSSIWVTWKTSSGTESKVTWGTASGALTNTLNGGYESITDAGYSGGYIYHSAKIEGLDPDTKYFYKIQGLACPILWLKKIIPKPYPNQPSTFPPANGSLSIFPAGYNRMVF